MGCRVEGRLPPPLSFQPTDHVAVFLVQGRGGGKTGSGASGSLDEEGLPRKITSAAKARLEASRKDKHR